MAESNGSARARLVVLVLVLAGTALLAPSASQAVVQIADLEGGALPAVDTRTATVSPTAAQEAAAARIGAEVRWNEFGTPQSLIRHGGYLASGVNAGSAGAAARAWLDENARLFRLASTESLEFANDAEVGSSGHAVMFRQRIGGLTSSTDGLLVVGLVEAAEGSWNVAYVSGRITGDTTLTGSERLTPVEAWVEAAERVGERVSASDVRVAGRQGRWTMLDVDGFAERQSVRPAAFPTPGRGPVRAYETTVLDTPRSGHDEGYWQVVDADSGAVLFRESVVDHAVDNPRWEVFPAYPPLTRLNRHPWNFPSADTRDIWCWNPAPGCQLAVANPAARVPWDTNARTGTPTFTTIGNAADSFEQWFSPQEGAPGTGFRPTSPTRDYLYPWTNRWFESRCDPAVFTPGGNDISAAVTNLFAMHNRMHDWSYFLGFTEQRWNAQDYNFGSPTLENDRLLGRAQSGAVVPKSRDNANMSTRPDGESSITNMFLWQPIAGAFYAPCVDGDYDMAVIGHEYGHMIENRMIGKGARRQGSHAGAMGESFGDLNAAEYLNEYNLVPVGGENPFAVGAYATGNPINGIRNYGMNFPSAGQFPQPGRYDEINPLNFGDVGYDLTGPQVHADGEIWSATNYGIRALMLDRYPSQGQRQRQCADGERPAEACPGNRRWFQLYYDAMVLMPVRPTFLDARDAMLAADLMRFGGANQDLLWYGFARRGFGQGAAAVDADDGDPVPDFESPLHNDARVTFRAVSDETGQPVSADVFVGHYEARATPIADTNPATAGPNRDDAAGFVPDINAGAPLFRAYDLVANAAGYGHVRFRLTNLRPGENRVVTIRFPTNYASRHQGAAATGDGERHADLIDDTEATNWQSVGAPAEGRQVLVDLAGTQPVRFRGLKVSAALRPPANQQEGSQNRFTALRAFEAFACTAGADRDNPTCDPNGEGGFKRILKSESDAFPGVNPRPVQPVLILRSWAVPTTTATHVLFRVVDNQCTGQESFQGVQDNDPTNETHCPATAFDEQVRAAELQVLSDRSTVTGAAQSE